MGKVIHETLIFEILLILLSNPTEDSVEVSIGVLKECGQFLSDVSPTILNSVFEQLKNILHEQTLDKRVQYMIEVMFAIRKDHFKEHPMIHEDLKEHIAELEEDQVTHLVKVNEVTPQMLETSKNVFIFDPDFQENEKSYERIKTEILGEDSSSDDEDGSGSSDDSSSSSGDDEDEEKKMEIQDMTATNQVALRRNIYLTIQSSLTFEECAHKMMKMQFNDEDYPEIFAMIVDCCSQQRTYEKFYGLLAGRFCQLRREHMERFEVLFGKQYEVIHRLETNKLRNVAKFFAHLIHSDNIPWSVFANVRLTEEHTPSSGRIFLKIMLQEVAEYMGIEKLNRRFQDPTMSQFFTGLFPRDNPKDTRFSINFLTTIGLGQLTDQMREHLTQSQKKLQLKLQREQLKALAAGSSSEDSSSSESSSSSSSSDSSSESSSSSSEEEDRKKRKRRKKSASKKKVSSSKKKVSSSKKKKNKKKESSSSEEEDSSDDERKMKKKKKKSVSSKRKRKQESSSSSDEESSSVEEKRKKKSKKTVESKKSKKKVSSKKIKKEESSSSSGESSSDSSEDEKAIKRKQKKISNSSGS